MPKLRILYTPSGPAGEYAGGFALNHLTGCPHGCKYCYAPDTLRMKRNDFHGGCVQKKDVLKRLGLDLADIGVQDQPIFLSFMCDPFPFGFDHVHPLTYLAMQAIHKSGNRVRILTKNPDAILKHHEMLAEGDEVGTTLVFSDWKVGEHWEPNVPQSIARIRALEQLRELRDDVKLWISFEPIVDPSQTLKMVKKAAKTVDYMWFGPLNHTGRLAPGYAELVPEVDWAGFVEQLGELMEDIGFEDWRIKESLREVVGPRSTVDGQGREAGAING